MTYFLSLYLSLFFPLQHCCPAARRSWVRLLAGGPSAWSLHVLPMHVWVLSRYPGFLPQSKNMTVRLIGLSKVSLGINGCVEGRLSFVCLCCPAIDQRPLQGVSFLSHVDCSYTAAHAPAAP
ncbi:hypothetical protein ILYODFUR_025380 [Ilyodon furcidens]|uniref:Secreted protein n=1 Tax=Ilyodon furcidens TaxID=33524 RepID=A0ABV0U915_9TELE